MKVINSKNTWYLIFGVLFILIVTIFIFNLVFKRTKTKLDSTSTQKRETLITQKDTSSPSIKYVKASPIPSPKASKKPLFNIFDTSPKTSPSPSPTPTLEEETTITSIVTIDSQTTKGGLTATKSSDLKVIDENGVVYLSTENNGESDTYTRKQKNILNKIAPPPGYADDLGTFINQMLRVTLAFSALLVFVQLVLGGLQWLTSGGDKGKVEEARNKITAAVVGLIIIASSYAIFTLILQSLGIGDINDLIKNVQS